MPKQLKARKRLPHTLREDEIRTDLQRMEDRYGFAAMRYATERFIRDARDKRRLTEEINQREKQLAELKARATRAARRNVQGKPSSDAAPVESLDT